MGGKKKAKGGAAKATKKSPSAAASSSSTSKSQATQREAVAATSDIPGNDVGTAVDVANAEEVKEEEQEQVDQATAAATTTEDTTLADGDDGDEDDDANTADPQPPQGTSVNAEEEEEKEDEKAAGGGAGEVVSLSDAKTAIEAEAREEVEEAEERWEDEVDEPAASPAPPSPPPQQQPPLHRSASVDAAAQTDESSESSSAELKAKVESASASTAAGNDDANASARTIRYLEATVDDLRSELDGYRSAAAGMAAELHGREEEVVAISAKLAKEQGEGRHEVRGCCWSCPVTRHARLRVTRMMNSRRFESGGGGFPTILPAKRHPTITWRPSVVATPRCERRSARLAAAGSNAPRSRWSASECPPGDFKPTPRDTKELRRRCG
jgi:hypothetical protein